MRFIGDQNKVGFSRGRGLAPRVLVLLSLMLAWSAGTGVAQAQGFFDFDEPAPPVKVRKVKKTAAAVRAPQEDAGAESAASSRKRKDGKGEEIEERAPVAASPLLINVSLAKQRLTVYDSSGPIAFSPVSTGMVGHRTPTGIFSVLEKKRMHYSNIYRGAPMPNMQRITWSGVAMHAGALPGYPASHGCVRLPHAFSKKLFGLTSPASRVVISHDPLVPVAFEHPGLFEVSAPEVVARDTSASGEVKVADASGSVIGVSPANAAPVTSEAAVRLTPAQRREAERTRVSEAIRTAGYKKAETAIALDQATAALNAATPPGYAEARAELLKLEKSARDAVAREDRTHGEIAELSTELERTKKPRQRARLEARLDRLSTDLATLVTKADAANKALKEAQDSNAAITSVVEGADAKQREARKAHADASAALVAALAEEAGMKRREAKRALPVSVFVSRATRKLYARLGYEPVLEVPVSFDRPDELIGTHVYTALHLKDDKRALTWNVVSVQTPPKGKQDDRKNRKGRGDDEETVAAISQPQTAVAALDRLTIPAEAREEIADLMKPGSSLIVSDYPLSHETGEYTDFIVLTR